MNNVYTGAFHVWQAMYYQPKSVLILQCKGISRVC